MLIDPHCRGFLTLPVLVDRMEGLLHCLYFLANAQFCPKFHFEKVPKKWKRNQSDNQITVCENWGKLETTSLTIENYQTGVN